MTLGQAMTEILDGAKFGDVYPRLIESSPSPLKEAEELREWFCTHPRVPVAARKLPAKNGHKPKVENSGKFCPDCGGARIVRTGSCETCQDCGRNEGCG